MTSRDVGLDQALREVRETRFLINRVDEWIVEEIQPYLGNRILEVGCGWGNLAHRLSAGRTLWYAIDNDPESIDHLRAQPDLTNVQTQCLDICGTLPAGLEGLSFDTVLSLNVLEHIEDDALALRHMRRLLTPGGHLLLVVPAHGWLYGRMDRAIGHFRRYSVRDMRANLLNEGFVPVEMRYLNAVGALGWLVAGRILRRKTPPREQLTAFNALVPWVKRVEGVIRPPFGVSLVVVAR